MKPTNLSCQTVSSLCVAKFSLAKFLHGSTINAPKEKSQIPSLPPSPKTPQKNTTFFSITSPF